MPNYIFRVDDICPKMDYEKFLELEKLFLKYNIPAMLCVIPDNKDKNISFGNLSKIELIKKLKELENKGWEIAMHGHTHEINGNGGILNINNSGEFTNLSYQEQFNKIKQSKEILEKQGFKIDTFTAPWHSFDKNTIKAVKDNNIKIFNEELTLFPYKKHGLLFIPNIMSIPRKLPFGTICFNIHPQDINKNYLLKLEKFIKKNKDKITTCNKIKHKNSLIKNIINIKSKIILKILTK